MDDQISVIYPQFIWWLENGWVTYQSSITLYHPCNSLPAGQKLFVLSCDFLSHSYHKSGGIVPSKLISYHVQISPSKQRHGKPSVSAHAPFSKISTSETHTEHLFIWLQLTIMQILYGYPDIRTLLVSPYKKVPTSITNSGTCSFPPFIIPKPKRLLWGPTVRRHHLPITLGRQKRSILSFRTASQGPCIAMPQGLTYPNDVTTTQRRKQFFSEQTQNSQGFGMVKFCFVKKKYPTWKVGNLPKKNLWFTQISQKWWSN